MNTEVSLKTGLRTARARFFMLMESKATMEIGTTIKLKAMAFLLTIRVISMKVNF